MSHGLFHCLRLNAGALAIALALHATVFGQAAAPPAGALPEDVVATVNGEKITRKQLSDELIDILGKRALERLIRLRLVEQEARKHGVDAAQDEVDDRLNDMVDEMMRRGVSAIGLKTMEEYDEFLRRTRGISLEMVKQQTKAELRVLVRAEILAEKVLAKIVTVSPEDVRLAYESKYGTTIQARQIVLTTRAEAEAVLDKLKAGADFELMAREKSIDVATRARGGEMRPISTSTKIGKAVAEVQPGGLSGIIQTDDGYHILKVIERNQKKQVPFEEVRDALREEILKNRINERKATWQAKIFEDADIQRFL
ncbi:MAG: peptidyl-prolyl cis-trans isomerase [Planctomycetota bacterium]